MLSLIQVRLVTVSPIAVAKTISPPNSNTDSLSWPLTGAVHEYHTVPPLASGHQSRSPGSKVAEVVRPITVMFVPASGVAFTKLSFDGGVELAMTMESFGDRAQPPASSTATQKI